MKKQAAKKAALAKKEEEQKKEAASFTSKGWTDEDVVMLTKGIVKFPPGTVDRWKTIGDFCGKTQKEAISKAKEI